MLPFFEKKNTALFVYRFNDFSFAAHFHNSVEIVSVESGKIRLNIASDSFEVCEGEIGVVFPGLIHSYEKIPSEGNCGSVVLLGQSLLGEYRTDLTNLVPEPPVMRLCDIAADCAHALEVLRTEADGDIRMQKAYAQLFLCRFFASAKAVPLARNKNLHVYRVIEYMEAHFKEDLSLLRLSEELYLSKWTVSGIFSRVLKTSFNDYLNGLRIGLAVQLMDSGSDSITAVAYEVGFGNTRTFNRAFKKLLGVTPSEYRSGK